MIAVKRREIKQAPRSGSNCNVPMQNLFYAHQYLGDQESSSDIVTGTLKVFLLMCMPF